MNMNILKIIGIFILFIVIIISMTQNITSESTNATNKLVNITKSEQKLQSTNLAEAHFNLNNGSMVICIKYIGGYAGGLSCDWEHLK